MVKKIIVIFLSLFFLTIFFQTNTDTIERADIPRNISNIKVFNVSHLLMNEPVNNVKYEKQIWNSVDLKIYTFYPNMFPMGERSIYIVNETPLNGAENVSINLAKLSVWIVDTMGGAFSWSIITSPNIGSDSGFADISGNKSLSIFGPLLHDTYYTWIVDVSGSGGNACSVFHFHTVGLVDPPTVLTLNADGINLSSAKLHGKIDDDGGASCQIRFRYRKLGDTGWDYVSPWHDQKTTGQTFEENITVLKANTTYEYQAGGKNPTGESWGNSIQFRTLKGDFSIDKVEVIQTIRYASELVMNKITVACVYVKSTFLEAKYVDIKLIYDFGKTYIETGKPGDDGVEIKNGENKVYIPGGPVMSGNSITKTAWIPAKIGPWLSWSKTGTDSDFSVEIDYLNRITEDYENNNKWTGSVTVVDTQSLSIGNYRVVPASENTYGTPSDDEFKNHIDKGGYFIKYVYPLDEADFKNKKIGDFTGGSKITFNEKPYGFIMDMQNLEALRVTGGYDRVVGIVDDDYFNWHGADADIIGKTLISEDGNPYNSVLVREGYWTGTAHEIGHTYGLNIPPAKEDYTKTTTGSISTSNGYWCYERKVISDGYSFMGKVSKNQYTIGSKDVWVADSQYNTLLEKFKINVQACSSQSVVLIRGLIGKDDSVDFMPMYTFEDRQVSSSVSSGKYTIETLTGGGEILNSIAFNPCFYETGSPDGKVINNDYGIFSISLPYTDEIDKIQIKHGDNTITNQSTSKHAPTINLLYPNGGEFLTIGNTYTIRWQANDTDIDEILTSVFYSADNGANWSLLTFETTDTNLIWDTSNLVPRYEYKIKLLATDGFHTTTDISNETFIVSNEPDNNPPAAKIVKPSKAIYVGDRKIIPFFITLVIGRINVTVNASDAESGIKQVELFIDDEYKVTLTNEPYSWMWEGNIFGKHILKVVVYDRAGHETSNEIKVWKLF